VYCRKAKDQLRADLAGRASYEDFVAENLCISAIEIEHDPSFLVTATAYSHDNFTVARLASQGGRDRLIRGPAEIGRDAGGRYALIVPVSGILEVQQSGATRRYGRGSMVFISTAKPFRCAGTGDNDTVIFLLPREVVDRRLLRADNVCGNQLVPPEGICHVVRETVIALHAGAASMSNEEFGQTVAPVAELIMSAFSGAVDLNSRTSPVRAANLARAKRIVQKRCADPDLTLSYIAKECGLSLRYLHNLFKDDGRTFGEFLMNARLENAHRLLRLGGQASVTDVCLASGFSNPSHFSAAFRRSYACSPRDVLFGRR